MKTIVITGSTRGIGYGLADSFLELGCAVTINGRTSAAVEEAVSRLASKYEAGRILGHACDVTRLEEVQAVWDAAKARFGAIDIWINNAGIGHPQLGFCDHAPEQIERVVHTNLVGAMYGAQVALRGMLDQGFGSFYNMEGLGSDGRQVEGLTLYGTTKRGLAYLTDALVKEMQGTPVVVGGLRPGMVLTEMLTDQYDEERPGDWEAARRIFNILADRVEVVTPWLARKILDNRRSGVRIKWLTRGKVLGRFLLAPFRERDIFEETAGG